MIVWKGWGILVFIIPLIFALLMQLFVDSVYVEGFYKTASWPMPLAFLIAAIPVFIFGLKLNKQPAKILIDPETNEEVELKTIHSFFWIPMQYWSPIITAISGWLYTANIGLNYQ